MDTKTIALDREAYESLKRLKRKGESFSDVVRRLTGDRRPLSDLAGLWADLSEEDLRRIEEFTRKGRALDRERLQRLVERMG